jgi:hypothetical protein
MNIVLTWTPGAGSTSQTVQYKLASDSTWTNHSVVSAATTTVTISGLLDNEIYDFRIVSTCPNGTSQSNTSQQIKIECVGTLTASATENDISYSFTPLGGSISSYSVKLFAADGVTLVATSTPTGTNPLTGTFTGLTAGTIYQIQVVPTAGSFTKLNCPMLEQSTDVAVCDAPMDLVAELEEDPLP